MTETPPESIPPGESRDGAGAGDHDDPYFAKGERMNTSRHPLVTDRQFARLQTLRSHIEAGDRVPGSEPSPMQPSPMEPSPTPGPMEPATSDNSDSRD